MRMHRVWLIDSDVARFRLQTMFKIMHRNLVHGRRRVRIQVLAFGVMPDVPREHEYIRGSGITPGTVIPDDGLLIEPIAVRAPTGHPERQLAGGQDQE